VSFLNDLKKQADQLRAGQGVDKAVLQARIDITEQACQMTFKYWVDLCSQLDVLQPVARGRYVFDSKAAFDGLRLVSFRPDIRKRPYQGQQVTDHVALNCDIRTGQEVQLTKNFLTDIEKLERRIQQSCVQCTPEPIRDPDTGKLIEVRYGFVADMQAGVRLKPNHDDATVRFTVDNLEGLARWVIAFEAADVTVPLLDELAKWIAGQPNDFARRGRVLELREC
jgi:hypothetical protein